MFKLASDTTIANHRHDVMVDGGVGPNMSILTIAVEGKVLLVDGVGEQARLVGGHLSAEAGLLPDDPGDDRLLGIEVDAAKHAEFHGLKGEHGVVGWLYRAFCVVQVVNKQRRS